MRTSGQWLVVSGRRRRDGRAPRLAADHGLRTSRLAFTLIELMVVVGIMALVLAIGIPFMANVVNGGSGINRAVRDVQEVCANARALAILQQKTTELVIRPGDGSFAVGTASAGPAEHDRMFSPDIHGNDWRMQDRPSSGAAGGGGGGGGTSVKLPEGVYVEGLGVNGEDWTDDAVARVRFYPNGTCDEMSVILYRPESGERRNVFLEVVTALADFESDPAKWRDR